MYEKENKKGSASSLRFNERQISIALSKSGKKSKQQLFDWLLERYVNGENPIEERLQEKAISFEQGGLKRESYFMPTGNNEMKEVVVQPADPLDKVSQFCELIQYADNRKEIEKYVAQAKKELDWKLFLRVQSFAFDIVEKKGFIYNDER